MQVAGRDTDTFAKIEGFDNMAEGKLIVRSNRRHSLVFDTGYSPMAMSCACGYPPPQMRMTFPPAKAEDLSKETKGCIESCLHCQDVCLRTATTRCIELGSGKQALLSLLYRCAQICQTAADFLSRDSSRHSTICRVCAETCEACAKECEPLGHMEECIQACRACAASCREMLE